jgi:hypothetical protein
MRIFTEHYFDDLMCEFVELLLKTSEEITYKKKKKM